VCFCGSFTDVRVNVVGEDSELTVLGNIFSTQDEYLGIEVYDKANVTVKGNILLTGNKCVGVYIQGESKAKVEGTISLANSMHTFIRMEGYNMSPLDYTLPVTEPGYLTYTDGANVVLVKGDPLITTPVCEIGGSQYVTLNAALGAHKNEQTIRLLADISCYDGIEIWNKKITFDLNNHTLELFRYGGIAGLNVDNGEVNIAGNGAFNVYGNVSIRVTNAGKVTVTNAQGYVSVYDGSHVTIEGALIADEDYYIRMEDTFYSFYDFVLPIPSGSDGYLTYTDDFNTVLVRCDNPPSYVCENLNTQKKYFTLQQAFYDHIYGDTIQLLADINYTNEGIYIFNNEDITFDLNGYTLNVFNPEVERNAGLFVEGGEVNINIEKGGEFNVSGEYGTVIVNGKATVTNVTGRDGSGVIADGSDVIVLGNVIAYGGYAVEASGGAKVTIDGTVTFPDDDHFIKVGGLPKSPAEITTPSAMSGYLMYQNGDNYVFVRNVIAVAWTALTANGTSSSVTTTELTLTFDTDLTTLALSDITLTSATIVSLTGTGLTRTLEITNITVPNGQNVTLVIADPAGYIISPSSMTVAVFVATDKSISVGSQNGVLTEGIAGSTIFPVTTVNITNNSFTVTLNGAPTGVTASDVTIASNTGTLTLTIRATLSAGTYPMTVTFDGVTSNTFDLVIDPAPGIILVTDILVTGEGGATAITTNGGSLQMYATVTPANATDPTVTWSVILGTGLATISNTGYLTASKNGDVTVRATANDGSGVYGELVITISAGEPPIITTASLPDAEEGVAYNVTLTATGTKPITWGITEGKLPYGLSLDANMGVISGVPSTTGQLFFTVRASNGFLPDAIKVFGINVMEPPPPPVIEVTPPEEPFCTASDQLSVEFRRLDYTHQMRYSIRFSDEAKAAGFKDTALDNLPTDMVFKIDVPKGAPSQLYTAIINVTCEGLDDYMDEYPITFAIVNNGIAIVNQPPAYQSFCGGATIALVVDVTGSANSYQWYKDNQPISGAKSNEYIAETTGNYYVEIAGDCGSIRSVVSVLAPLTSSRGATVSVKTKWGNLLYVENASEYQSFQWYHNGTPINGATFVYLYEKDGFLGDYYVRGYKADGSFDETCSIGFDVRTRIGGASVYPTALKVNDVLNINVADTDFKSKAMVEIYSLLGVLVYSTTIDTPVATIRPDFRSKGNYFVKIMLSSGHVFTEKIIVQ